MYGSPYALHWHRHSAPLMCVCGQVSGPGVAVKAAKAAVTELATKGYCTLIQEKVHFR